MKKRNTILLPRAQKTISVLGENIKLARLRRKFSAEQVAERANISRPTLVSIEKGNPNVNYILQIYIFLSNLFNIIKYILFYTVYLWVAFKPFNSPSTA